MLIAIEGIDFSGKSTLAERLRKETAGEIIHASKPTEHPLVEYETRLKDYRPNGTSLILDRWHVGERIWPTIFSRKTEYDRPMFIHTELFLESRGCVMVHADRNDRDEWLKDLADRDEPIQGAVAIKAQDEFRSVFINERCWNDYLYDFKIDDLDDFVTELVAEAQERALRAAQIMAVTTEYVGRLHPSVLLVGERQNDGPGRIKNAPSVPFAPYRSTSGHFLFSALDLKDYWKNVGVCNAFKDNGEPEDLHGLWQALGRPKVVALGAKAHEQAWLELGAYMDIPKIPHPQYQRQFKRAEGASAYLELLKKAVASQ